MATSTTVFQDTFSEEIWGITYKDHNDKDINDTFRRVAKAIASVEETEELRATWEENFYDMLTNFKAVPGGRILSNAGTEWKGTTLANCFVGPRAKQDIDSLPSILYHLEAQSKTLKSEGGWGENFSYLRPRGAFIHGIGVESPGAVKYMELFDKTSEIITSGSGKTSLEKKAKGKIRKGAQMAVMDVWHPDIIEFITAKQQPGRLTKFNVSVNCTDEFMNQLKKVIALEEQLKQHTDEVSKELITNEIEIEDKWDLIFPETQHAQYKEAWDGNIKSWLSKGYPVKVFNTVSVRWLWNLIMESTFNRAEPGVLFLDRANYFNPFYYGETIAATNPCLTGDTLVAVADGRNNVSIGDLAIEGKDVPVFCYDNNNNVIVRKMRNPRITGYNEDIYEVVFDDGSSIKGTANHKLKCLAGEYKEISELQIGDSIKTMQKYHASWNDIFANSNSRSGNYMWLNSGSKTMLEHRLIAEYAGNSTIPAGYVVHHIDFNPLNNNPSNLKIMTKEDHDAYHASLMHGNNNPMRKAKYNWSKQQWLEYKGVSSPSFSTVGEKNPRYSGITNAELYKHAILLTQSLGHRFSIHEWQEYASEHGLIQQFSEWRANNLHGGIKGMALKAAIELGLNTDLINLDPRIQRVYLELIKQGYDVSIIDRELYVNKTCEMCNNQFDTPHYHREVSLCSPQCSAAYTNRRIKKNGLLYQDLSKKELQRLKALRKEEQAKIYNNLKFAHKRMIFKKEWENECKNKNIAFRLGKSSPFKSMADLREYASNQNHRVVEIRYIGKQDVYNGTVDDFHNFFIGGFESITRNNKKKWTYVNNLQCGEQTLSPGNICCLGSLNLTQFLNALCSGFNLSKVKKYVAYMVRFLDNVNSYSTAPLPEYIESMRKKRRIGLGVMGWGSALFMLKTRFASEEANKLRDELMSVIAKTAYETSIDLAIEKGMFEYCDPVKHADGAFVKQLNLSEEYMQKLRTTGIRNSSLMSQQPTGSTSICANVVSGGIEPLFMAEYIRTTIVPSVPDDMLDFTPKYYEGEWKETKVFKFAKEGTDEILKGKHNGVVYKIDKSRGLTREVLCEDYGVRWLKAKGEWDPKADWAVTTTQISAIDHVVDLKGFSKFTDSACSKTINVPNNYSFDDFKNIYLDAYDTGYIKGITTYRAGTMAAVLSAKDEVDATKDDEEIIVEEVKMPASSPAIVKVLKAEGRKWYLTVIEAENSKRPYALFVHTNSSEKGVTTNDAVVRMLALARKKKIKEKYIIDLENKLANENNVAKIARSISLLLRHGVLIKNIVYELNKVEDVFVNTFLFQITKYLSQYIKDGTKVDDAQCAECGSPNVTFAEGCYKCMSCGSSKC